MSRWVLLHAESPRGQQRRRACMLFGGLEVALCHGAIASGLEGICARCAFLCAQSCVHACAQYLPSGLTSLQ